MSKVTETSLLANWKLKLGILMAIVSPTVTGTAAYYKLQIQLDGKNQQTLEKVNKLELDAERNFASKQTMEKIKEDVSKMKEDLVEIKTLLKRKLR